jgi:ABC-type multidrug transport system fused ATPase/permease subunit
MVRLHPRYFFTAVAGAAVFAVCTVASTFAIRWAIDNVILPRFEEGDVAASAVVTAVVLIVSIGVVRAVGVVIRRSYAGITQWRVAETLTDGVIDRLVDQPVTWHQRYAGGDLVARAGVDVEASVSVLAPIPFATSTVLMVVVATVWMFVTDPWLGLVAIVLFPLLIVLNVGYQRRVEEHFDAAQGHLGRFSAGVLESFDGVQLVKAYGAEQRETARLASMAGDVRDARVLAVRLRSWFESLLELIPALANVAIVVIGARRVDSGDLSVGQLASAIFLFSLLVFPLRLIGFALSELPRSMAGWLRLREVLDAAPEDDPRRAVGIATEGVGLDLDAVSFTFPGEREPILDGVALSVPRGGVTAVVGATGAGKTTLVEVAVGLIRPDAGAVAQQPGRTAVVLQEPFLFAGTVRENLTLGAPTPDPEVWEALRLAAADAFVRLLPAGLDTTVGERGVSLSGGQRQRIALARALVRRPSVLVLDDTTSALDPSTEAEVLGNLRRDLRDTTVLVVASRPSTIALADTVAHMVGGRIVATGPHRDLLASEPDYRALVEAFESDREGAGVVEGSGA